MVKEEAEQVQQIMEPAASRKGVGGGRIKAKNANQIEMMSPLKNDFHSGLTFRSAHIFMVKTTANKLCPFIPLPLARY